MNADSSWGEVRWREPQSDPSANDPTVATRTLLAGTRTLNTEGHDEHHTRLVEPHRRIDHGIYAPQANLYMKSTANKPENIRLLPESRYLPDYLQNTPYGQQNSAITSPLGSVDGARTGSMSSQMDQSRRTSELQPTSDARISSGECFEPSFPNHQHSVSILSGSPVHG
jgi:hypothetical protein